MEEPQFIAVVVVYNCECENSETCKRLTKIFKKNNIQVVVIDNSTIETKNVEVIHKYGWTYLSMEKNLGLSVAYNCAINYINDFSFNKIIIWFDDDTEVTEEYFIKLRETVIKNSYASIFVPIIYGIDNKIYSPNSRRFFRNKLMKNEMSKIYKDDFNAINSCMAIRMSVFKNYRYDENLFLDSVDQKFCEDMCKAKINFNIVNVKITQNFFQRSKRISADQAWKRYRTRIRDFMCYANKDIFHRWLGVIKVFAWGVQMGIKCRSFIFLLRCIKLGLKYAILLSCGITI